MKRRNFLSSLLAAPFLRFQPKLTPAKPSLPPGLIRFDPNAFRSVQFVRQFDPIESKFVTRMDVLYGFSNPFPTGKIVRVKLPQSFVIASKYQKVRRFQRYDPARLPA